MGREAAWRTPGPCEDAAAKHGERAQGLRRQATSEQGAVGASAGHRQRRGRDHRRRRLPGLCPRRTERADDARSRSVRLHRHRRALWYSRKLAFPDKPVVVATGDGAFGFNAIEIDTAVRHKAPVLIVVANNGAWQIEVHDQTVTHGKVVGTRLQDADYAAMARSFGMHAERVETEEQLGPAIERALANRPALLDMVVTPEAISSDGKTGLAGVPDLQPLAAWDEAERKWRAS
jgi:Thiamine pyrophosphate enzyme, C-terminal TPP binding domain